MGATLCIGVAALDYMFAMPVSFAYLEALECANEIPNNAFIADSI